VLVVEGVGNDVIGPSAALVPAGGVVVWVAVVAGIVVCVGGAELR